MKPFKIITFIFFIFSVPALFSQEALKSAEEEYYDFLSLQGMTSRPSLNYRTLSDSEWTVDAGAEHVWFSNNLGTKHILFAPETASGNAFLSGVNQNIAFKLFGPEWFNSFNTAAPYGQNDGALWQGRGYNTSLTAGIRFEAYGLAVTFKPQLSFSQNMAFDYIKPNYKTVDSIGVATIYNGKASEYGYYGVPSIDAPQRFGDNAFFTFDWGDSEIRYTWKSLTVGFGTQTIWLGPAQLNPIIHSNNAASYPKIDIGFRRTQICLPWLGWYIGDMEARGWWGKLTESDYFDTDESNNNNLMAGLSVAYAPSFLPGLTIGFNRTMLSKWSDITAYTLFRIYTPFIQGGSDASDQRFSFTFDYVIPKAGFEVYLEWARNDFSPNFDYILRYPFHTQGWTFGAQKALSISANFKLKLLLELTYLECSADYDRLINWYSTFYAHHLITQGYTNGGQWLGAGIGTGGNSQYFGIQLYHKKGDITLFAQRRNPDLDYTMYIDAKKYAEECANGNYVAESNIRMMLSFGLKGNFYIQKNLRISGAYIFTDERNPLNKSNDDHSSKHRYNNTFSVSLKYNL